MWTIVHFYLRTNVHETNSRLADTSSESAVASGIIIIVHYYYYYYHLSKTILDRIQKRQLKWYGTFLEWKIVVGQRIFTTGHRTVGGEDRNNHGGTKRRTS